MADRIELRDDSAANWASSNPVLGQGEVGIQTGATPMFKIGDGVTHWNDLPYEMGSSGGGGAVSSVFNRTGAVTAQSGDYTAAQVGALPSTDSLSAIATANPAAADVPMNNHKFTGMASGSAANDSATVGQIPTTAANVNAYPDTATLHYISTVNNNDGDVVLNNHKLTGLANGSAASDAATFGQIPTSAIDQPWQFRPESYGTAGDGKIATDVSCNGTQTFTSATVAANATAGMWVMIDGGRGTTDTAAMGVITGIAGNNVTISAPTMFGGSALPITASASSLHAVYGTDCTAAINSAVSAASTYAQAHNYFGEILFKDKIYIVAGNPTQTNASPAVQNAQIPIPFPTNNGRKLTMAFTGVGDNTAFQFWGATNPQMLGSVICSIQTAPGTQDLTFGPQSVIGGPTGTQGFTSGGSNPNWPNVKAVVTGMQITMPVYTHMTAFDFTYLTGCKFEGSVQAFANPLNGNGVLLGSIFTDGSIFGSRLGVGLRCPGIGNNADVWIPNAAFEGITCGLIAAEHVAIGNLKTLYNAVALSVDTSQGANNEGHGVIIERWTAEAYQGAISAPHTGICYVDINIVTEGTSATYDVNDSNNALRGIVKWFDPTDSVTSRFPIVNGGAGVKVVNQTLLPGYWSSAPAVPATTVAVTNANMPHRDAMVVTTGGTVSAITVDGQAVGVTTGVVFVPAGKTISVTYSAAPTWKWWLL